MQLLLEQMVNGCAIGALYGLFAIGFGLVFSTLGILNAAHGCYASFAAIAGYYAATSLRLPFAASLVAGVVTGAALAIHEAIMALARQGAAVLVISQDLDEVFVLADQVAVIAGGRLSAPVPTGSVTVEDMGRLMGGAAHAEV